MVGIVCFVVCFDIAVAVAVGIAVAFAVAVAAAVGFAFAVAVAVASSLPASAAGTVVQNVGCYNFPEATCLLALALALDISWGKKGLQKLPLVRVPQTTSFPWLISVKP